MQVAVMAWQQTLGLMTKPHPIVFGCFKQYSLTPELALHALHLTCSVWQHTLSRTSSHPVASGLPLQKFSIDFPSLHDRHSALVVFNMHLEGMLNVLELQVCPSPVFNQQRLTHTGNV